jgi:2-polyprenyl-3-methyl-5-hydroxy-6-metoxy-1,4-benzoquinol methylase
MSLAQRILNRARRIVRKGAHTIKERYWHSGERVCPDYADENFASHLNVYKFASQFTDGKKILDIGCGTGYGTAYLSKLSPFAIGIDLSSQAIRYARRHYNVDNLRFARMKAEQLGFADRSFDFIISNENFEHLRDQRSNLREMARVLNPDGMLLLATPNYEMFIGNDNPYHTHEVTYREFLEMLQEFFYECAVAENLLDPVDDIGLRMKAERSKIGAVGANLLEYPVLWGLTVDTTYLSNTHSFIGFARRPRS